MKVLFTASIAKHILRFHLPYLKLLKEWGCEIHVACSGQEQIPYCDNKFDVKFVRSPYNLRNIFAYNKLKKIILSQNYNLIHSHTPVASILTRLAAIGARKKGTKVLYTAHGFHFYKGSPAHYWLLFYPIERYLSRFTDAIITINREDFIVVERSFHAKCNYLINGVGVDEGRFKPVSSILKSQLRMELGYKDDCFILFYAAEFIARKNHRFIVDSALFLKEKIPNLKILFAGRGALKSRVEGYANLCGVSDCIDFLGFRSDINKLICISDIGISASKQEGLGINLIEEMLCGLPVIASRDRGHCEIINHGRNGYLYDHDMISEFCDYVLLLQSNKKLRLQFGENAHASAQKFSIKNSLLQMSSIYKNYYLIKK